MSWDPREQECRSYFGYGTGFFMAEDAERARLANYAAAQSQMFCNGCPIATACWHDLQERVRREQPEAAAKWDAIVERNTNAGIDSGRVAAALLRAGRPDPWMKSMLENIQRGQEARELAA